MTHPTSAIRRERRPLSVVIPTLNGGSRFEELLERLAEQDVEGGFELVVVDSESDDGTREAAVRAGAFVHRIRRADFNHGATRNLGIARSSGAVVCLLTQDAVPMDASYLARMAATFDDASIDGAYARQFPLPDCDPLLKERLRRWSASRTEFTVQEFAPGDAEGSRALYESLEPMQRYLACAFDDVASALRRSTWETHPLPTQSFGEDVAWAREVLLAGGRIAFQPDARVEHSHRIEMGREFRRLYADHRNLCALFGLVNVPTWRNVLAGWGWQRRFYRDLLRDLKLPLPSHLYWRAYSIPYALGETTAQYLGARSRRESPHAALWKRLNAWAGTA